MSPYQILGLPFGERDLRKIKRAYSRLLRQHRPERDPEGFRRIRDAYELLKSQAQEAASFSHMPDPPVGQLDSSMPSPPPSTKLPELHTGGGFSSSLKEARRNIEKVVAERPRDEETLVRLAREFTKKLKAEDGSGRLWQQTMSLAFSTSPTAISRVVSEEELAWVAARGALSATNSLLTWWWVEETFQSLIKFAKHWKEQNLDGTREQIDVFLKVAYYLALVTPMLAEELLDKAYVLNSKYTSMSWPTCGDHFLIMASEMGTWKLECRCCIAKIFVDNTWNPDEHSAVFKKTLFYLATLCYTSGIREYIQKSFPSLDRKICEQSLKNRSTYRSSMPLAERRAMARLLNKNLLASGRDPYAFINWREIVVMCVWLLFVLMFVFLGVMAATSSSPRPSSNRRWKDDYDYSREAKKIRKQLEKIQESIGTPLYIPEYELPVSTEESEGNEK